MTARSPFRALFEFHVARDARDQYEFDQSIFQTNGNVIFPNFHAARLFAQRMNEKRDLAHFPEQTVRASQINAMGLIDEVMHVIVANYRRQVNPKVMSEALEALRVEFGPEVVEKALYQFGEKFPPIAVYRHEIDLEEYLAGATEDLSHREMSLEEKLMLWLSNLNPAFTPYRELFDDSKLAEREIYEQMMEALQRHFAGQPGFGPADENLIDMLRAPTQASPHSLAGQLTFIRQRWGNLMGPQVYRLLTSEDFIREEEKPIFFGPGPVQVSGFADLAPEPEQYSPDLDWMPRVVLLARNAYVWLDQLSKQYSRPIVTLDQIPDEELDILARRGVTGLWLIGLWERSKASQRIKQMMGNPEAVASAYSLYDYAIAADLGGPEAMNDLRWRAWQRGLRMASDMVPNHMGIDSQWVIQHPDWFVSVDQPPFPSYSFNSPDLSGDERVGVFLEDHYFDRTDAAVVFKRIDRWTGDVRYIYHGNDGTTMPWNDTAQLDYLKAEVREAVIQTILDVARQFPIIRFDAAMTLAKRHIQRLWFPEPGAGGAIASRSEHGLTKADFDAAMPNEFWREVVDRVATEVPDTLLLAEAFWLLEGYFVRTLGMHRVYNSAFMHMLRDEDNDKYRYQIKSTLEFDPEILKRYVNFMSNPDEETAVGQFDKGDKYFGVCTVMITVPGLPMFGHGQFEGFTEKYGMEYRRAYYDEKPDAWLVARHEREISPLLHKRYLFAEVANFRLYDFSTPGGEVDENVLAYSNRFGDERALVVYHNKWSDTRGWIRASVPFMDKAGGQLLSQTIGEGMELTPGPDRFIIFRDHISGQEFIRRSQALHEQGLYVELGAYQRHVFLDWRQVQDDETQRYRQIEAMLAGRGVPSVAEAIKEILLQPLHFAFRKLFNAGQLQWLLANRVTSPAPAGSSLWSEEQIKRLDEIEANISVVLAELEALAVAGEQTMDDGRRSPRLLASSPPASSPPDSSPPDPSPPASSPHHRPATDDEPSPNPKSEISALIRADIEAVLRLPAVIAGIEAEMAEFWQEQISDDPSLWAALWGWAFTRRLGQAVQATDFASLSRSGLDDWLLRKLLVAAYQDFGLSADDATQAIGFVKVMVNRQNWLAPAESALAASSPDTSADTPGPSGALHPSRVLNALLGDADVQALLGVNRFGGVLWYNQQPFAALIARLCAIVAADAIAAAEASPGNIARKLATAREIAGALLSANSASEYRLETLMELAE